MAAEAYTSVQAAVDCTLWLQRGEKWKGSALKCCIFEVSLHVRSKPGTSQVLADLVTSMPVVLPHSPHQNPLSLFSSDTHKV